MKLARPLAAVSLALLGSVAAHACGGTVATEPLHVSTGWLDASSGTGFGMSSGVGSGPGIGFGTGSGTGVGFGTGTSVGTSFGSGSSFANRCLTTWLPHPTV